MANEKAMAQETEIMAAPSQKMEFRLINPTEDGFLRVIKWNKDELKAAIEQKIAGYENVVYTEDNMKQAKADRAELNKLTKVIEDRRKMVKGIITAPYTTFDGEIKEVLALIKKPIGIIDKQVKAFENQQKEEKKRSILASYEGVIGDLADVLPFEKVFDKRYLNQTYKLTTAQADVMEKVRKVQADLDTIDSLESKYKLNAKDVYIKTLDLSKALAENKRLSDLEKKLEAENKRKAEEKDERERLSENLAKAEEEKCNVGGVAKTSHEEIQRTGSFAGTVDGQPKTEIGKAVSSIERQAFASAVSERTDIETAENVSKPVESVNKIPGNISKSAESVQKPDENVVAPPAGNASVADPFTQQEDTKKYKASFTVYGTKAQIMALRQYMVDNNIRFGKAEK